MRRLAHLGLILLLALTGVTLGHARGQARAEGTVVLCAGGAVTVVTVDRDGHPVPVTQLCPDMALSLMAALDAGPAMAAPRPAAAARREAPLGPTAAPAATPTAPQARGPPIRA